MCTESLDVYKSAIIQRLRQRDLNQTFDNVVLDRRGRCAPKLLCRSDNVVVCCDTGTGELDFLLMKNACSVDGETFWTEWPSIDQWGTYKKLIDKCRIGLNDIMAQIRDSV